MDLGAILDGAFSIYRRYTVALLGSVAVIVVPISLLEIVLGAFGFVVGILIGVVTPAIGALVAGDVATGRIPSIGGVWRRVLPLILPLALTGLLVILAEMLGLILLIVPGILFYVWFSLSAQALVIENRRYRAAMGRSRQLVKGSWWRVFGILIVIGLVTSFDVTRFALRRRRASVRMRRWQNLPATTATPSRSPGCPSPCSAARSASRSATAGCTCACV
jgi:hypothetical protein